MEKSSEGADGDDKDEEAEEEEEIVFMITQFRFAETKTVHSRVTPSMLVFLAQFGGWMCLVFAIGSGIVSTVPEYLFKISVIESLFRFKSELDLDTLLNKKGQGGDGGKNENNGGGEEEDNGMKEPEDSAELGSEYAQGNNITGAPMEDDAVSLGPQKLRLNCCQLFNLYLLT